MGYFCNYCGECFDVPSKIITQENLGEFWRRDVTLLCPYCGESDPVEGDRCPDCDGIKVKSDSLCFQCRRKLIEKFQTFVGELSEAERETLDDLLDGCSILDCGKW